MTISAVRQPQGIPAGGQFAAHLHTEPGFHLEPLSTADLAARAAAATPPLVRLRAFLQEQTRIVEAKQRAIACAAAAHHVLQEHPDAATLVFAVKDGHPGELATVMDSAGRILPAHRVGPWADTVMAEVRHEPASNFIGTQGVEASGTSLRIDIAAVVTAAADSLAAQEESPSLHAAAEGAL